MEDDFDIRTLPANFVSKSQPSIIIERLNEKRKNAHNEAIEEMRARERAVNIQIEEEIRNKSSTLKQKLKRIKDDIDESLFSIKNTKENDIHLEDQIFEIINKRIAETNEIRRKAVQEFYKFLVNIDNQRSEQFKLILNETYAKLLNISYELPFKLEEFFENEFLKINQITLNNFQNYAELQSELALQIENDTRLWIQTLYEIKERVKLNLKSLARGSLIKSRLNLSHNLVQILSKPQMVKEIDEFGSLQSDLENQLGQIKTIPVRTEEVEYWLEETQIALAALDQSAKNIVDIYRSTIVIIFNRFFEELEDIKKSLINSGIVDGDEIEAFQREFYTPTVDELNLKYEIDFEKLKNVWDDVINSMRSSVDETYIFLKDSAFLWDLHFQRIEEVQQLVKRDVKNIVQKNNINAEIFESKLGLVIDTLRQGPTQQKLEKCLTEVKKALDNIQKVYCTHCAAEMKVVEKYRTLVNSEVDVLMSELTRFLTIYPADEERDPKKQRKRASQISELEVDSNEDAIPMQMLFCKFQVDAVRNWQFGLWEAINQYVTVGRAEIMLAAEEWMKIQFEEINERLTVKIALHKPRYERVICSVYEKRLYELDKHARRFTSHKLAVEMEIKKLKERQKLSEEKYNEICKTYSEETGKIDQKILNTKNSSQVRRLFALFKTMTKKALDSIDNVLCDNTKLVDKLMEDLKVANAQFAKAVKFFSERGNFTTDEAKSLLKNLTKLEKTTVKSLAPIIKDDKIKQLKFKGKLDTQHSEVSSSILELIREHEHNEKSVEKIQKLQNNIRADVINLKRGTKNLVAPFKELVEASTTQLGRHEYIETFSNQLRETVTQIIDQATFLMHPQPVVMYSCVGIEERPDTQKSNFKDYTTLLFDFKPNEEDECFVSKLNNHLYNSFQDIQLKAKEFYSNHEPLLDSSKMQPTYDHFMEEVLEKYKKYLIQCEICWAENVSEFLNFVNDFLLFKEQYLSTFENKFYNNSHDYCSKVIGSIVNQLQEVQEDMKTKLHAVHTKLKALYGHPNNRHLLDEIDMEFKELGNEIEEKLSCILEPYKNTLVDECKTVKDIFGKTNAVLKVLSRDDGLANLKSKLNEQLAIKLEFMREMVGSEDASETSEKQKNELILSVSKQVLAYMRNIELPLQVKSATLLNLSTVDTYEESSSNDFLNELDENLEKHIQTITDFVEVELIKYHEKFREIWPNEINTIVSLYEIKYDKGKTIKE